MRKGFTLIELLVVVLIMGILASVALPQYFKSVEKSRSAEAIEILNAFASSYDRTYMKKGAVLNASNYLDYEFDIGMTQLSYFTNIVVERVGKQIRFTTQRNMAAGGGLGSYVITLSYPLEPPGKKTWQCSPTSAGCKKLFFADK